MSMDFLKIQEFDPMTDRDSGYTDGDLFYRVDTLIGATKSQGCKKFKYDLKSAAYSYYDKCTTAREFALEVKRTNDADLSYPIILTPNGHVADGFHRLAKAFLEGRTWVWAYRLNEMPKPDEEKN